MTHNQQPVNANGKVQIRVVDSVIPSTQLRAGRFRERITWDGPDNWVLRGNK
ncbi:hypothetical protein [Roseateles sp.]|uniref:hypothetical protein n=1 Tax=Roseateles sp. TaxID=1971397 RepID=UPI0031DC675A